MKLKPAVVLALALASAPSLVAQTGVGRIQGTVRDASGAAIPNAEIAVVNEATQIRSETKSNISGVFVVPSLPSGVYDVAAAAPGMAKFAVRLELAVGQTADLPITLEVTSTQTSVSVTAEVAQLVTVDAPTVSSNVENPRLQQLPLDGRFLQQLLTNVVPGLEGGPAKPQVFGMREGAMEFTLDGAVLSDRFSTRLVARAPGLDSVSEVRVESSVPSAKLNRPATAILSTKSGTNEVHGSAFYTTRNNAIGVARRREEFTGAQKLIRNEYGATLGGPLLLPKMYDGRNRTFFFTAWEDYRMRQNSNRQASIATMPMRQGDFSQLTDSIGRTIAIYDPYSTAGQAQNWARTPYPENRIPVVQQSPLAQKVYAQVPEPTYPAINPNIANNFFKSYPNNNDHRTFSFRGDHRLNDKHTAFGRFTQSTTRLFQPSGESEPAPVFLDQTANLRYDTTLGRSVAGNWLWVARPSFFVETTANWSVSKAEVDKANPAVNSTVAKDWGLPNAKGYKGIPDLINMGFDMTVRGPFADDHRSTVFNFDQNYSKLAGKHQIESGWHWRQDSVYVIPRQYPMIVEVAFYSNATALYDPRTGSSIGSTPQTGHEAANFYLGVAGQYLCGIERPDYTVRTGEAAGYAQDKWRITRNLTLNLGLRWEYFAPFGEKDNSMVSFAPKSLSIVLGNPTDKLIQQGQVRAGVVKAYQALGVKFITPEQAGLPSRFLYRNWTNFNPRIGLAYRTILAGRTLVIRGGFGGYHFPIPTRTYHQALRTNAPFEANVVSSVMRADQSPDGLPNLGMRSAPRIVAGRNSENAVTLEGAIPLNRGFYVHAMLPQMPTPVAWEWNLTTEYEFLSRTVFRLGYTGTAGRNQEQWEAANLQRTAYNWFVTTGQPLPTGQYASTARRSIDKVLYGEMRTYRPEAYNNYNGVRAEVERRFSKGLATQFFYMFSQALGTGWAPSDSGYSVPGNVVSEAAAFLPGAVPEDYTARARFLTYKRDLNIPHHRFNWNFLVDLPFGKGKPLVNTQRKWLDRIVGGWQVAGLGSWRSRWWQLPETSWGLAGNPEYYGTKYPIEDCRSGACFQGYLYYNGYISKQVLNQPTGIKGVPQNYKPSHQPVNPAPAPGEATTLPRNLWDTNQVTLRLANGSSVATNMDAFLNPWRNQIAPGPWSFGMDASLFKRVPITERLALRLNFDAFNVFNAPGLNMPNAVTGIISLRNSNNTPRQLQFSGRLEW